MRRAVVILGVIVFSVPLATFAVAGVVTMFLFAGWNAGLTILIAGTRGIRRLTHSGTSGARAIEEPAGADSFEARLKRKAEQDAFIREQRLKRAEEYEARLQMKEQQRRE